MSLPLSVRHVDNLSHPFARDESRNASAFAHRVYPTAFCAAAPKCILHVKLDPALAGEFVRRQNPKSCEIRDEGGLLSDGCHNFRISILTVAEREPARTRASAPALSNVQTFALYFNFATLNMPSPPPPPPTSSTPALSSSRGEFAITV